MSKSLWKSIKTVLGVVLAVMAIVGCAGASPPQSWEEEALLHDGRIVVVQRNVRLGGRHEVGQKGDYIEQSLRFTAPGLSPIEWVDEYSKELGNTNFLPMLLDVVDSTPYLVVKPMGCDSYNKWGRPNPPYVVFKHTQNAWQQIPLQELPPAITTPNLIRAAPDMEMENWGLRKAPAAKIQELVNSYKDPEMRRILREPLQRHSFSSCVEIVKNEFGFGKGIDWFKDNENMTSCKRVCQIYQFGEKTCPCNKFFKEEN